MRRSKKSAQKKNGRFVRSPVPAASGPAAGWPPAAPGPSPAAHSGIYAGEPAVAASSLQSRQQRAVPPAPPQPLQLLHQLPAGRPDVPVSAHSDVLRSPPAVSQIPQRDDRFCMSNRREAQKPRQGAGRRPIGRGGFPLLSPQRPPAPPAGRGVSPPPPGSRGIGSGNAKTGERPPPLSCCYLCLPRYASLIFSLASSSAPVPDMVMFPVSST